MSESFLQQLYEPFAREDNSMTHEQGTGLGLSITQSIPMMGGTIEAKADRVREHALSLHCVLHALKKITCKSRKLQSEDNVSFEGFRVLLTEDNELNREISFEPLSDIGLE